MTIRDIVESAQFYGPRFADLISFVMEWECVLRDNEVISENDPDDPGGLTFAGLDRASHPQFNYAKPTAQGVANEYYNKYWTPTRAEELHFPVGEVVCNFAINMGLRPAVELLQTAINILPDKGATIVDGIIGPATIAAANEEEPHQLADLIEDRADLRYRGIAIAHPHMKKFLQGWLNRDNSLKSWWKDITLPV